MKILILFFLGAGVFFFAGPVQAEEPSGDFLMQQERVSPEFKDEIQDWQARLELARLLSYVERYEESIAQYRRVLDQKPDLVQARLELARVYYWTGDIDKAQEMFASVPEDKITGEVRLELAEIYAMLEQYVRATETYRDYLQDNPGHDEARFKLARVLSWKGDYEASIQEYERVLESRPGDNQVRRHYAQVLMWAERYDEAIEQMEKTLESR